MFLGSILAQLKCLSYFQFGIWKKHPVVPPQWQKQGSPRSGPALDCGPAWTHSQRCPLTAARTFGHPAMLRDVICVQKMATVFIMSSVSWVQQETSRCSRCSEVLQNLWKRFPGLQGLLCVPPLNFPPYFPLVSVDPIPCLSEANSPAVVYLVFIWDPSI